jgi:NAD(P)-dependent dehydrogenase (short-subunit alcohol dehydrogenase family)
MTTLRDKRCFITGAASGIGRATALAAAAEGAVLFLTDVNRDRLEDTVRDVRAAGGAVAAHRALDVSDYDAVRAFAETIHDACGSMDIVMNIAGISVWGAVDTLEHRHWRQVIEVNLMGPIHVIESFVPDMIRAGRGGHVVNVSSAAGLFGLPFHAAYSGAKFGLRGISEVLRFDLERHGIKVSLVCPGAVNTGLVDTVQIVGAGLSPQEFRDLKAGFRRRAVTPEKAARAILRGVKRDQYLVFTSNDTRLGHWFQRKFGFVYERAMRRLNDRLYDLAKPLPPTRGHERLAKSSPPPGTSRGRAA